MKPANKGQLTDIFTYHVLQGQFRVKDLDLFQPVETVEGKPSHIQKWGISVKVGLSLTDLKKVTSVDNQASNGAVHIIDGVLLPPLSLLAHKPNIVELAESVKDLSTLVSAVIAADAVRHSHLPCGFRAVSGKGFGCLQPHHDCGGHVSVHPKAR
jgi:transforming growth factor-beta-induced protein